MSEKTQVTAVRAGFQTNCASIGGTIFMDLNGNGLQGNDEQGASNITMNLYTWEGTWLQTSTTDSTGNYRFNQLTEGLYYVHLNLADYTRITGSSYFGSGGNTGVIELSDEQVLDDVDAGIQQIISQQIDGRVWEDQNRNGQLDEEDTGIVDITLTLYTIYDTAVATTQSDANGFFTFSNVFPGLYYIKITIPDGYKIFAHGGFGSDGKTGYLSIENQTVSDVNAGLLKIGDTDQMIFFPDKNLADALYLELGCPVEPNYDPETRSFRKGYLQSITEDVNLADYKISDLTGLENLINVTYLDLQLNYIKDISALAPLSNLKSLLLSNTSSAGFNFVDDLNPLSNLTGLERLDFSYANISDISPLISMTHLKFLNLSDNNIVDLYPLINMTNMLTLQLKDNEISDINPLVNMTNLQLLDLSWNRIPEESRRVLSHLGIYEVIIW